MGPVTERSGRRGALEPGHPSGVVPPIVFKVPPQIPGRKSVDGVGSDGVGHAKHAREDSPDVSPGFRFKWNALSFLLMISPYRQFLGVLND